MATPKSRGNAKLQAERRRMLINATMSTISEHGFSQLTLAKIANSVGMTAGSVNFHFDSKEALLLATLEFVAQEFDLALAEAVSAAGHDPAARLQAIIDVSLDPAMTELNKVAVWHAFAAEGRARADYKRICGSVEQRNFEHILSACTDLIHAGDRDQTMNARAMASAIQGLIDELWEDILYTGEDYDRESARRLCASFLASVFPWAFEMPPNDPPGRERESPAVETTIRRATPRDTTNVAVLFDLYRQFYEEAADPRGCEAYIGENLRKKRSTILLAETGNGEAVGFTQLYPAWCSVEMSPYFVLYDLYVNESARGTGLGRDLMNAATDFARSKGAHRLDLETAHDNYVGQSLYESLGYKRDMHFWSYSLALT